jgi:hypothetical protein
VATEWIMVRLDRATHARLVAIRDRLERAREIGRGSRTREMGSDPSLSAIVSILAREVEQHLARSAAQRGRRKQRGA